MNSITVCGNIGRDPELSYTTSGRPVAKFSIADQRPKDKDGNEVTQWFNCRAYDRQAELIKEYFSKGKPIWVQGVMNARLYKRDDGMPNTTLFLSLTCLYFWRFGGPNK